MKKPVYIPILIALTIAIAVGGFFFFFSAPPEVRHATLYAYDATALNVPTKNSSYTIVFDDLVRMDREAFRLISRAGGSEAEAVAIYERLVSAQYDFIALSYALTGEYRGSVVPITQKVLCKELAEVCADIRLTPDDRGAFDDSFTQHLSEAVFARINDDWEYNAFRTKWNASQAYTVPDVPVQTVLLRDVATLKRTLEELTEEQKRAAIFWSGTVGTKRSAGIWLSVVDDYLSRLDALPLRESAMIRARALSAARAAFEYATSEEVAVANVRPLDVSDSLVPLLPYDETPGYPAAPVAYIAAISEVLAPRLAGEDLEDFHEEVREAIDARLWSGAFLPKSVEVGERLGRAVGGYDAPLFDR